MNVLFATKDLQKANEYIDGSNWQALKENKEAVLKSVEEGLLRVCDPFMYGSVKLATGDRWYEKHNADDFSDFIYKLLNS